VNIFLKNKNYQFLKGYQKNDELRNAFNDLSLKVFKLDFEVWYQSGYWNEKYVPYTLFDDKKAIANVSINIMDFIVLGKKQRYIQLGTVMTDEEYRHQGLSLFLMKKILEEWNSKCDFVYLFANSTVLDFYPKFGFSKMDEYVYFKKIEKNFSSKKIEKLNMDLQESRNKLHDYAKNTKAFSKISMQENADLVLFYSITILKEDIYYIKSLDAIVVAQFNDCQLHIFDVFAKEKVDIDKIISVLAGPQINEVLLGFTPENSDSYQVKELVGDDALFIQKDKTPLFEENKIMFPLLSHA